MSFRDRNKKQPEQIHYEVQALKTRITNDSIKEICESRFDKISTSISEVIIINQEAAKSVLSIEKWPFTLKTDNNFKTLYVAYANAESGAVLQINCLVVDDIAPEVEQDLANNKGIIRISSK